MCGEPFTPRSKKNVFCERRCFKLFDYRRHKELGGNTKKFPVFTCPTCRNVINLDFHPIKRADLWLKFKCPHCNILMINVVDSIKTLDFAME